MAAGALQAARPCRTGSNRHALARQERRVQPGPRRSVRGRRRKAHRQEGTRRTRAAASAAYRPLAKATAPDAQDRPALVKEFLDGWYKNMKDCYWHGTHTDKEGSSYFGYWAFEAALVTVLWNIDDSSYREHLVYPKDLADWAREHRSRVSPHDPSYWPAGEASTARKPLIPGGEPCPQAGWWFTPAQLDSRRYFDKGEIMPIIKDSSFGDTNWQQMGDPKDDK
ncbi:PoNe immunity protein domain-containing protein [Variovorax paradoxus]|uniref:PoNe immunity protein domain-containing protein n=1 Tax=Variovorax paradoxus TaxID=34073 RepID=UPI0029C853B9|nr:PoNe immunity protein domain-containing protein [Variovorax paradoxus]WPH21361.1 DUF1911 domain-containing protein [Variovorax paradoxus]